MAAQSCIFYTGVLRLKTLDPLLYVERQANLSLRAFRHDKL